MSKHASNDPETTGYFLPEDSQLWLAKLGDHIRFLSRLAQPHMHDQAPEARLGELATCLELLAEQVDLLLAKIAWPYCPDAATDAPAPDAEAASVRPALGDPGEGFAFGVTVDQVDALDHLIQTISAHGDVLAAGHVVELAGGTLPWLGQMMYDDAKAVRDILNQVEAQRLGQVRGPRTGVREERAGYDAELTRLVADGRSRPVLPPPAYMPLECLGQSHRFRPH